MKPISFEEAMNLPKSRFIARCKAWIVEFNEGKPIKIDDFNKCPVQVWIVKNNANCGKDIVPLIATCPICGMPCCPDCMNHSVVQLSRVTGYVSDVAGWNASKKQELKDRQRCELPR